MAWLHQDCAVQQLGEGVFLYDLGQIRGIDAILDRIPDRISGVYAWYRKFEIPEEARHDPSTFAAFILEELYKPHCVPRTARIPPSTKLKLQAETVFYKQNILEELANSSEFRKILISLLENSILFQQPLYIGQSNNAKIRIKNHLEANSILRERLQDANHDIEKCRLLIIDVDSKNQNCLPTDESDKFNDISIIDNETEFPVGQQEKLIEDILSRLFLPPFTLRYG